MQLSLFDLAPEVIDPDKVLKPLPAKPKQSALLTKPAPVAFVSSPVVQPPPPNTEQANLLEQAHPIPHYEPPRKTNRLLDNLTAIRTLYKLEEMGAQALPGDKELLARYTSFGALSKVFEPDHEDYQLVKELLQPDDYAAARLATVNSFYTQHEIVRWMWDTLIDAGFEGGQVLDPAMATGNFFAAMPHYLRRNSTLFGVEMDCLAGRIGAMIHDDAQIHIKPYQKATLPDNAFDVTITNVPFGDIPIHDKSLGRHSIHNYFIMKMATQTRPGGFVAVITSRHTLDSKINSHREWLAQHLDLIAALRLPSKTFQKYAGTDVVIDLLIFHKPQSGHVHDLDPVWLQSNPITLDGPRGAEAFHINQFFLDNPQYVLGSFHAATGPFATQLKVDPGNKTAIEQLHDLELDIQPIFVPYAAPTVTIEVENDSHRRPGEFFLRDGELRQQTPHGSEAVNAKGKKASRIIGQVRIVTIAREVLKLNTEGSDAELASYQQILRQEYDAFVAQFGCLNAQPNRAVFKDDPNTPFLWALETKVSDNPYAPSQIFYKRTIQQPQRPDFVEDATDALAISIADTGGIDWPLIERLTQKERQTLQEELSHLVFLNPDSEIWESSHVYLSGNVRKKLEKAQEHGLAANIKALETVIPDWLDHSQIHAAIGAPWIDVHYIAQFHFELLDPNSTINRPENNEYDYEIEQKYGGNYHVSEISIRHSPQLNKWIIATKREYTAMSTEKWGTHDKSAYELIAALLNKTEIKVWDIDDDGNKYLNQDATIAAQQKAHEIKMAFKEWIWTDETRRKHLEHTYNHTFNATVPTEFDGSWLNFPGMSEQFTLRPHQADATARILKGDNTLLWHIVGAGKSATMIASAMKAKQLGLRNKPLHLVPNHLLHQYAAEFYRFYPNANLLVIDPKHMAPNEKARAMAQIATGDWDSVIMTHSSFSRIPISPDTHEQFHQRRMDAIDNIISELAYSTDDADKRTVKQLEKKRLRLHEKYERTLKKIHHEKNGLYWEHLGVDLLYVDECQEFKNLYFESTLAGYMPGISGTESGRAYDMYMKTQQLTRRCVHGHILGEFSSQCHCGAQRQENTSLIFASGTPVTNSICEMYTLQRFLQLDALIELGIHNFDSWATQFGDEITTVEMKPSGKGWRQMTRFARFHNVPELLATFGMVSDAQMDPKTLKLERPKLLDGEPVGIKVAPSDALLDYVEECAQRAENIRNVDPTDDNMLKIMSDALKAATDMRLIDPAMELEPGSKIDVVTQKVFRIWQEHPDTAQAVFLDIGTPKPNQWNLYEDMKQRWIEMGIPEHQIAFAHDARTDAQRKEIFTQVNEAEVKIILGSTMKMGSGTNMQHNLYALHHIDAPWTPALVEQREGRILRQGNTCPHVEIYRYVTERSLDFYKWHLLETKARFIAQIALRQGSDRSVEDIEASVISFAQMKAMATGDPLLIEQVKLEADLNRLGSLVHSFQKTQRDMQRDIHRMQGNLPNYQANLATITEAIQFRNEQHDKSLSVNDKIYAEREAAVEAVNHNLRLLPMKNIDAFTIRIGVALVKVTWTPFGDFIDGQLTIANYKSHIDLSNNASGCIARIHNAMAALDKRAANIRHQIDSTQAEIQQKQLLLAKSNPQLEEYDQKMARLDEIHDILAQQAIQEQNANLESDDEEDAESVESDNEA